MLINRRDSSLLIIDFQARLLPHIADGAAVLGHARWLAAVARRLGVPVVFTEQNRDKLGATDPALLAEAGEGARTVGKMHFSAVADGCLAGTETDRRPQVVVCGMEAHVCVQQTALALRWQGKQVFLVAEAAGSRKPADRQLAIDRMQDHGIEIVSREMVAFEWLERAGTDEFREISRNFIR